MLNLGTTTLCDAEVVEAILIWLKNEINS